MGSSGGGGNGGDFQHPHRGHRNVLSPSHTAIVKDGNSIATSVRSAFGGHAPPSVGYQGVTTVVAGAATQDDTTAAAATGLNQALEAASLAASERSKRLQQALFLVGPGNMDRASGDGKGGGVIPGLDLVSESADGSSDRIPPVTFGHAVNGSSTLPRGRFKVRWYFHLGMSQGRATAMPRVAIHLMVFAAKERSAAALTRRG